MSARRRIPMLSATAALLIGVGVAFAQQGSGRSDEELDNLTAQVAAGLRCLVCRGQSVLESSSQLAQEMKGVIRDRLASGETPEQVKAYFVSSYGDYILLKPKAEGVSLLVYVLPALALVGGGVLLFRLLGRWTRPAAATASAGSGPPAPAESAAGSATPDVDPSETISEPELSADDRAWLQGKLQDG